MIRVKICRFNRYQMQQVPIPTEKKQKPILDSAVPKMF